MLIVAVGAIVAWVLMQRQRTQRLRQRFGPKYNRAVDEFGGQTKAEAELAKREQHVARLNITALAPTDAAPFSQACRFIDNPNGVVAEADLLVRELMVKRGYPMGDFERRAADISVVSPGCCDDLPGGAGHRRT